MGLSQARAKARISAVVPVFILEALDAFKKSAGLRSRSAAAAEALSAWAADSKREEQVGKAVAKYAAAYGRQGELERQRAEAMLPLVKDSRRSP